ncbi:RNA-binding protein [Lyngbya sp. PCC 8106]|uniref:RNA recognition motif domain-containing protein n=1 Tax=Lyngbya sp. (strain PCC 8106) TaxID=313612 RepID=UPI0000EAC91D|nr:RNA-binding protein [Lyngbya sp. PCC 8106]EAW37902.1 RNA-binding region protein [Lyngbya sp. PCC 8106]
MPVRLYVGNLPKELERKELQDVFVEEGDSVSAKVITDRKTGKCRGFGFVTVQTDEIADQIVEKYNGFMFKENPLKIEKALPRKKGKSDKPEGASEEESRPAAKTSGAGKKKKSNRGGNTSSSSSSSSSGSSDSVQPDPRWADQLEKLKEMLNAQTTN